MGRPCAACSSPRQAEIDRKLRSGSTNADVSRWLTEVGSPITPHALGRHAKGHLGVEQHHGRKPISTDFLQAVVDDAAEQLATGDLRASLKDGIGAQKAIDARQARNADRDLMLRIAVALTGGGHVALPAPDPELVAVEGEFKELLLVGPGD